ncbi:arginine N-succinyltransferase [Kangiella sp. TOML190]|uniref:arginine N-succinyltransferase n=1 Tax=Kangiella sp. TOML190 TaxID=2931351 RepID=UPI00204147E9|nr:arginine N-succinyltransferase [Kangiella sp. TOML190]
MMVIRPAQTEDLDDILALAAAAGTGLTTLPNDPVRIGDKIQSSINAFTMDIAEPGPEYYFFVLEDLNAQKVVGTSALVAAVGMDEAFYTYKLSTVVNTSHDLGIYNKHQILVLGNDYTGATEIATLFLSPEYRGGVNGRLLAKSRFLFMADFPERFADTVIAEMRGYSDDEGKSPFWRSLGKHFFNMPFAKADAISGLGSNQFIAELMPQHPIYVTMLTKAAQEVIGQVHPKTKPAISMLKREGFRYQNYVDIFDAGPTIEAPKDQIKTYRSSKLMTVKVGAPTIVSDTALTSLMVSNRQLKSFKTCVVESNFDDEVLRVEESVLKALKVSEGDSVRVACLRNRPHK